MHDDDTRARTANPYQQHAKEMIYRWLHRVLGEDFGGTPAPPGSTQGLWFGEPVDGIDGDHPMFIADTSCNDGHELWIGYAEKWLFHCRAADARRLAWFILWDWWIVSTWCGLKRRIWYAALHKVVEKMVRPK